MYKAQPLTPKGWITWLWSLHDWMKTKVQIHFYAWHHFQNAPSGLEDFYMLQSTKCIWKLCPFLYAALEHAPLLSELHHISHLHNNGYPKYLKYILILHSYYSYILNNFLYRPKAPSPLKQEKSERSPQTKSRLSNRVMLIFTAFSQLLISLVGVFGAIIKIYSVAETFIWGTTCCMSKYQRRDYIP